MICMVALQWSVTRNYRGLASERPRLMLALDAASWPESDNPAARPFRESSYDPAGVQDHAPQAADAGARSAPRVW